MNSIVKRFFWAYVNKYRQELSHYSINMEEEIPVKFCTSVQNFSKILL